MSWAREQLRVSRIRLLPPLAAVRTTTSALVSHKNGLSISNGRPSALASKRRNPARACGARFGEARAPTTWATAVG